MSSLCSFHCRFRDVYTGSWFLPIPDPGSRIPDPKKATKDRGEKEFVVIPFQIQNYFSFEMLKKKIWVNFQRIIELFTQKIVTKLSKIWVWDPGSEIRYPRSEIRDPEKMYSGSRIPTQVSKRHRIPDLDPQHWFFSIFHFKTVHGFCTFYPHWAPRSKHPQLWLRRSFFLSPALLLFVKFKGSSALLVVLIDASTHSEAVLDCLPCQNPRTIWKVCSMSSPAHVVSSRT